MKINKSLLSAVVALALLPIASHATGIVIGAPGTGGNCFPFGCSTGGDRYQQVYAASDFAGPMSINDITFYDSMYPGNLSSGTFSLYLSTTSAAVNGLSATMDDNLGANNALFGTLVGGIVANPSFTITGTSFAYDPGMGNLLLEIRSTGQSGGSIFLDARNGDAGGLFSRMHNYGGAFAEYGLVTGFNVGAVPEPGTVALMLCGLAVTGIAARRRRAG